jgi:rhodanese-related sulfurtransferase
MEMYETLNQWESKLMKKLLWCVMLVAVTGLSQQRGAGQQPAAEAAPNAVKELHRVEIDALLAKPEQVLVLDVRSPGEIAYWGAFPVFLSVQTAEGDTSAAGIEKHLAEIPKDRPIVTVSGRANRSGYAAAALARHGFKVMGAIGAMTYGEEGGALIKFPPYTHWSMNGGKPPARGAMAARDEPKAFKELHRAEIDALPARAAQILVLDVRSPGEIAYWGAFPVFLSVQSDEGDTAAAGIERHLAEIPKGRELVTVSGRANRSGFAASVLATHGFKVAGAIGAMTYGEEGGQLIKLPPYTHPSMTGGTSPQPGH